MSGFDADKPGALLARRFRLERKMGSGREGVVWRARDEQQDRAVAVKLLREGRSPSFAEEDLREAKALEGLRHPHLARLLELGSDDGRSFLVLDLVEGERLDRALYVRAASGRPYDPETLASLFAQICDAVGAAHDAGVIHRDLKPANLILAGSEHKPDIKVVDFGVAHVMGKKHDEQTTQGRIFGSYAHMAPEQSRGQKPTPAWDVFALGSIFFEIATLHRPWERDTDGAPLRSDQDHHNSPVELATRIAKDPRPRLGALRTDLPRELEAVLQKAMSADPDLRPKNARELGRALSAAMGPSSKAVAGGPRAKHATWRRGVLFASLGAAGGTALGLVLVLSVPGPAKPGSSIPPSAPSVRPRASAPVAAGTRHAEEPQPPPPSATVPRPGPSQPRHARPATTRPRETERPAGPTARQLLEAARREPGNGAAIQALAARMASMAEQLDDPERMRRFKRLIESSTLVANLDELEQILVELERAVTGRSG